NLLLLHEPTSHLDLDTREALTRALAQFDGTPMLVSHDRHLLRATTDQFLLVSHSKLQPFDGDLADNREYPLPQAAAKRAALAGTRASNDASPAADAGPSRKEARRAEAEERQRLAQLRKPLERDLATVEKKMAALQTDKTEIDAFMADES